MTPIETKTEGAPVLVTTAHKGVFFGYVKPGDYDEDKKVIRLSKARNCIYWASDVKGFLGLAVTGPSKGCRIGPAVRGVTLNEVTSIAACTSEAVKAWESQPWG